MGSSARYDEWNDNGRALSDEEVSAYDVAAQAEFRAKYLIEKALIIQRYLEMMDARQPARWRKIQGRLLDFADQYCVVGGVPTLRDPDEEAGIAVPDPETAYGHQITVWAVGLVEEEFMAWIRSDYRTMRVIFTTMCRRQRLTKVERSLGNRISNVMENEWTMYNRLAKRGADRGR